jgi:hypothetical protein
VYKPYVPPPLIRDIQILHETYLIWYHTNSTIFPSQRLLENHRLCEILK